MSVCSFAVITYIASVSCVAVAIEKVWPQHLLSTTEDSEFKQVQTHPSIIFIISSSFTTFGTITSHKIKRELYTAIHKMPVHKRKHSAKYDDLSKLTRPKRSLPDVQLQVVSKLRAHSSDYLNTYKKVNEKRELSELSLSSLTNITDGSQSSNVSKIEGSSSVSRFLSSMCSQPDACMTSIRNYAAEHHSSDPMLNMSLHVDNDSGDGESASLTSQAVRAYRNSSAESGLSMESTGKAAITVSMKPNFSRSSSGNSIRGGFSRADGIFLPKTILGVNSSLVTESISDKRNATFEKQKDIASRKDLDWEGNVHADEQCRDKKNSMVVMKTLHPNNNQYFRSAIKEHMKCSKDAALYLSGEVEYTLNTRVMEMPDHSSINVKIPYDYYHCGKDMECVTLVRRAMQR